MNWIPTRISFTRFFPIFAKKLSSWKFQHTCIQYVHVSTLWSLLDLTSGSKFIWWRWECNGNKYQFVLHVECTCTSVLAQSHVRESNIQYNIPLLPGLIPRPACHNQFLIFYYTTLNVQILDLVYNGETALPMSANTCLAFLSLFSRNTRQRNYAEVSTQLHGCISVVEEFSKYRSIPQISQLIDRWVCTLSSWVCACDHCVCVEVMWSSTWYRKSWNSCSIKFMQI